MEWFTIFALFLFMIVVILLSVALACMLAGQRCTISIQRRTPNHELTRIQQEQEEKRQKKFSSRLKEAFGSSSKSEPPPAPVEDTKTVVLTFELDDNEKSSEQIIPVNESSTTLQNPINSQANREARQKRREEMRRKYNL